MNVSKLDEGLAVRIFDCLHRQMLQFMNVCSSGDEHHFMFIYHMDGASNPYEFDVYPTGKCGKKRIEPTRFTDVFSKNPSLNSPEKMLRYIEAGILRLAKGAVPLYKCECRDTLPNYGTLFPLSRRVETNPTIDRPSPHK